MSLLAAGLASLAGAAKAEPPAPLPPVGLTEVFASDELTGLGLRGFDPVTYFYGQAPKPGRSSLESVWSGLAWRFASEADRSAFERNPEVYAPRIGGYDAGAAAGGTLIAANPAIFLIHEGRLYLFRTDHGRARFLADPKMAERAEAK